MDSNLKNSLLDICKLFEKHNAEYILIGGTAVALHGYYRLSLDNAGELINKPDIDIWYNPSYENYFKILKVIEELGLDTTEFKNEQSPNPIESFFKLDFEEFTIDILPKIKAPIRFLDAFNRKETIELEQIQIHFMNYNDLLEDKNATARNKDLEDIEQLKKIKREK
jgi:hypothetical protein